MKKLIVTVLACVSLGGCASVFTDIRANGDGTYAVTLTKQGFFRVHGEVYDCVPKTPREMMCTNVDRL